MRVVELVLAVRSITPQRLPDRGDTDSGIIIGNHTAVTISGMNGQFELNVFKPVLIRNLLHSIRILSDAMKSFEKNLLAGLKADEKRINTLLHER